MLAAAEEKRVLLVDEILGYFLDAGLERQQFVDLPRQRLQLAHHRRQGS